jgi:hypothetical protein|tara:strand:- start:1659 stop:2024 length:366 start_codon:yes stop_codon:yes gene_type:complete
MLRSVSYAGHSRFVFASRLVFAANAIHEDGMGLFEKASAEGKHSGTKKPPGGGFLESGRPTGNRTPNPLLKSSKNRGCGGFAMVFFSLSTTYKVLISRDFAREQLPYQLHKHPSIGVDQKG